jgi:hypothetical protein
MMDATGASALDELTAKVSELAQVCARLTRENASLHQEVTRLSAGSTTTAAPVAASSAPGGRTKLELPTAGPTRPVNGKVSRRLMGKAVGAAAVTAMGAAALVEAGAQPAAAATAAPDANGNSVTAGNVTKAEAPTAVLYDGSSGFKGVVLLGNDSAYNAGDASYPAAAGGWAGAGGTAGAGGVANGMYGYTDNGAGYGVVGYNSGSVSGSGGGVLALAAGSGAAGVRASNSMGSAVIGTSQSTSSGVPAIIGVISSSSPGGFSSAIRGQNNSTTGLGIGVWGSQAGGGWGVYATSASGIGVVASGGTGTGVSASGSVGVSASGTTAVSASGNTVGVSAAGPTAIQAAASGTGQAVNATNNSSTLATIKAVNSGTNSGIHATSKGRGGVFGGSLAQVQLTPGSGSTHPKGGSRGDLYADKTGRLWFCKKGGTTATWHQIA